jgi:hypothetical protein
MDSSRAHRLFAALDAIWIGDPTGDWITEVLGIHTIRGEWWMQIAAQGNSLRSVNVVMPWYWPVRECLYHQGRTPLQ